MFYLEHLESIKHLIDAGKKSRNKVKQFMLLLSIQSIIMMNDLNQIFLQLMALCFRNETF